jgi:hypothetical protein
MKENKKFKTVTVLKIIYKEIKEIIMKTKKYKNILIGNH